MESIFVLLLVAVSSLLLWLAGRRWLGLTAAGLGNAVASTLECLGVAALLYGANLALGVALTALARVVSGDFLSLYLTADPVLIVLSLLQALVFCQWRRR